MIAHWFKFHRSWLLAHDAVAELPDEDQVFLVGLCAMALDEYGRAPLSKRHLAASLLGSDAQARVRRLARALPGVVEVYEAEGASYVVVRPVERMFAEDSRSTRRTPSSCPPPAGIEDATRAQAGARAKGTRTRAGGTDRQTEQRAPLQGALCRTDRQTRAREGSEDGVPSRPPLGGGASAPPGGDSSLGSTPAFWVEQIVEDLRAGRRSPNDPRVRSWLASASLTPEEVLA